MAKTDGILPIKLSLTEGDYYTLWAPSWKEHGAEWQAFLGKGENIFFFDSPAQLLAYLKNNPSHDLADHPKWRDFQTNLATRITPNDRDTYDIIGVPALLAERPSHSNVKGVSRAFAVARGLGNVAEDMTVGSFFSSYSLLGNVDRGSDHFGGENGLSEWSAIGRTVYKRWDDVVDALDALVHTPDVAPEDVSAAETEIEAASVAAQEAKEREEKALAEQEAAADPYDLSLWGTTGIDPIKIAIDGRLLYTLRTYINNSPVFLGKYGEIRTFTNPKALLRWLVEHDDHDLNGVSTWSDVMDAVNGGTAELTVHKDNVYTFTGLTKDIAKGPQEVDTEQMRQAYELLADAADWADDDSLNSLLLANPGLQDYISYMLGSHSSYLPSAPYTDEAEGWKQLEDTLTKRFSKI